MRTAVSNRLIVLSMAAAALLVMGCSKTIIVKKAPPPPPDICADLSKFPAPAWITKLPSEKNYYYSLGVSGSTYHPEDAPRYAGENAMTNLMKSFGVEIKRVSLRIVGGMGARDVDEAWEIIQKNESSAELLESMGAELVETWRDTCGTASLGRGKKGMAYGLARMSRKANVVKEMAAKTVEQVRKTKEQAIGDVRKDADRAFEELEAMESKQDDAGAKIQ